MSSHIMRYVKFKNACFYHLEEMGGSGRGKTPASNEFVR